MMVVQFLLKSMENVCLMRDLTCASLSSKKVLLKVLVHLFSRKQSKFKKKIFWRFLVASTKKRAFFTTKCCWTQNSFFWSRCFWNVSEVRNTFPSFLVSTAIFNFSILASSANCERAFSRMGWMISARRVGITATNTDKRLTLCNQLPQKRRLLKECWERKIKRAKLNEDLFKWTNIHMNIRSFQSLVELFCLFSKI